MKIDLNDEEALKAFIANKTPTKDNRNNFFNTMSKLLSQVEENEIKDMNWGSEFNRAHAEHEQFFKSASVFTDGDKYLINGLKNSWMKLEGQLNVCTDELRKEKLIECINFIKKEIIFFDKSNSEVKEGENLVLQSNTAHLRSELKKYGFFELEMITDLTAKAQEKLIELISSNKLPYQIAMIEYLGFAKHLQKEYFKVKNLLFTCISEILKADKRSVKGNFNVLNPISNEQKMRYSAHLHKEKVQKDYQELK